MTDLDRSLIRRNAETSTRLRRCSAILARIKDGTGRGHIRLVEALRNEVVDLSVELARAERAAKAYDDRLREAMEDPTGQDLDTFPFSE